MAAISVVIPNRNRRELLERLMGRLRAQTLPPAEIIVVDDASADGSAEAAQRLGARTVHLPVRGGFAKAVNRGLREASAEFAAIVNNDVTPEDSWLEKLVEALGAAGPRRWFATGKLLRESDPGTIDGTFDLLCRGFCPWRAGHNRPDGGPWNEGRAITLAPLTAALFRRGLFDRVGLLDERFESYLEDVDFGLRCAMAGFSGVYVPEARATHAGSATLGRWSADTVRLVARNQVLLAAKHYPSAWLRRYGWPFVVAQTLWCLVAARHGAPLAAIRGKLEGLRAWGGTRPPAHDRPALERVLSSGEAELLDFQRRTGFDVYWRLYSLLT